LNFGITVIVLGIFCANHAEAENSVPNINRQTIADELPSARKIRMDEQTEAIIDLHRYH